MLLVYYVFIFFMKIGMSIVKKAEGLIFEIYWDIHV